MLFSLRDARFTEVLAEMTRTLLAVGAGTEEPPASPGPPVRPGPPVPVRYRRVR